MTEKIPKIEPIKLKDYTVKQSKFDMVPRIPMRSLVLAPSGGGKTILIQNLIMNIYKDCFNRVYIFSPSINVDYTWQPVKRYMEEELKLFENDKEKFYYDKFDVEALTKIIDTQHKIIQYLKRNGKSSLFSILVIIDDFADNHTVSHHPLINSLFTRGRHNSISTIVSTQKFRAISNIIRVNATELYVFRLRNYADLESFVEEVSAIYPKKTILEIYNMATDEPYSFLYVNLRAKRKQDTFYIRFEKRIEFDDN
jgi:stress-induced morphogen